MIQCAIFVTSWKPLCVCVWDALLFHGIEFGNPTVIPSCFHHGIKGQLFLLNTRICFHSFFHPLTFSLFFHTIAIHSFIKYVMLDIMPGTKKINEPWISADIYQTQPRTYFRILFLREKGRGDKRSNWTDKHRFFWLDSTPLSLSKNNRQSSAPRFELNHKKVDDSPCSPFRRPHLILRG